MANKDRPRGFEIEGQLLRESRYVAGGEIYPGDAVSTNAAGQVVAASATSALLGVAIGRASSGEDCMVADHPDQKYVVQADGADVDAQTDIGLNYDIVATAGNSAYEISRMELDSDTGATTATLPLKLLDIVRRSDNALGAQVDCIVKINNHQLAGSTGTAGV